MPIAGGKTAPLEVSAGATPSDVIRQLGMPEDGSYLVVLEAEGHHRVRVEGQRSVEPLHQRPRQTRRLARAADAPKPLPPEESVKRFRLPKDLGIELVLGQPVGRRERDQSHPRGRRGRGLPGWPSGFR